MKTLSFDSKYFDAVICLNSDLPDKTFFDLLPDIPILAADGASLRLLEIGIEPDYIIGDLDSFDLTQTKSNPTQTLPASREGFKKKSELDLKPSLLAGRVWVGSSSSEVIHFPDQNSSDFEKVLNWAKEYSLNNLLIIGFHGGELEHTLNNWSILMKYSQELNLCVFDKFRYGVPLFQSISYYCKTGEMISIIPYQSIKLTTKNLQWELNSEVLEFGKREGSRNRAISNFIELDVLSGSCLLFIDSKLPFCPVFSIKI